MDGLELSNTKAIRMLPSGRIQPIVSIFPTKFTIHGS